MPAMGPNRAQRIEELYFAAVEQEPAKRGAFLIEACGGDDSLCREVESLLAHQELSEQFLEAAVSGPPMDSEPPVLPSPLIGHQIGAYRITGLLGVGGMGEVYRAVDTKLGRDVAIKVLPRALASDPDRLRLLEQEARVLASLNHPHIASIYGFEEEGDVRGIVLELVDGPTLADRLSGRAGDSGSAGRASMPMREALMIAAQIASAVEAAHVKGIVHRDLKPANIKVTPDGVVKVLDFGIARATVTDPVRPDSLPPVSVANTHGGLILGTPAYMSPEQARGERLDRRTDCWSFGCVLFELLAGRPPFSGDTVSDTLARVLEQEPDWTALPGATPRRVRTLLRSCLEKDRDRRLDDVGLARAAIETRITSSPAPFNMPGGPLPRSVTLTVGALAIAALVLALAGGVVRLIGVTNGRHPGIANARLVTGAIGIEDHPSWSRDGGLAYESNAAGHWDIFLMTADGTGPMNLTADHAGDDRYPSWSPDGRYLAFWSDRGDGGYYVVPATGGVPALLIATPASGPFLHGAPAWSPDGVELAGVQYTLGGGHVEQSIEIVSVETRASRRVQLTGSEEARFDLSWSPNGRYIAYVEAAQQLSELARVRVVRLADGRSFDVTDGRTNARRPRWSPDGRYLLYVCNCAGPSDIWRQAMTDGGPPRDAPERVTDGQEVRSMDVRTDGRLAVAKGRWVANVWRVPILTQRPATWADAEQMTFDEAFIEFADVSRDGRTLAYSSDRMGNQDLWVMTIGSEPTQITSDAAPDWAPRWSPDGRRLAFYSHRSGDRELWTIPATGGQATQLTRIPGLDATPEWSPLNEGRIAFRSERTGDSDVWVLDGAGHARPVATHPAGDYSPSWSPDGLRLAFTSLRSGHPGVWITSVHGGEPSRIGSRAASSLRWAPDGEWIYFAGAEAESGNIWGVSPRDERERPMTSLAGKRGSLVPQPPATDGTFIYFSWRDDRSDIWVMDLEDR
jgi:Tol biopolymer transport system component/serine/threonine protein kinase